MNLNENEIRGVLEENGAILRGHFKLSSGRHSDVFVQKFRVLEHPGLAQRFGQELAESFPGTFDTVASPAVGAVVLGFATALAANAHFVFSERDGERMEFRRGFVVPPHARVLVVEDVITTGGSALEVVELVRRAGAEPVGVGALIDRDDPARRWEAGVPLHALVRVKAASWAPEECPLCARDQPLDDPGSRRLAS